KGEEYTFCVDGPTLKPAYAKGNQYDDGEFKFNNRTYYGYEMVFALESTIGSASATNTGTAGYAVKVTKKGEEGGTATVDINATDEHGASTIKSFNIVLPSDNELPTSSNNTLTTDEDIALTFEADHFAFNDTDADDNLTSIKITYLPTHDLKLDGVDVTLNQEIAVDDIAKLTYLSAKDENGESYDSFKFRVSDGKGYSENEYSLTINVTPVVDGAELPELSSRVVDEDATQTSISGFATTNADGNAVSYDVETSSSNIEAYFDENNNLIVKPLENIYGNFSVEVNATVNGVSTVESFDYNVTSVNDMPIIAEDSNTTDFSTNEDNGTIAKEFSVSDVDGNTLHVSVESNNTEILTISDLNLSNENRASYNLNTVKDAYGEVEITLHVNDGSETNTTRTFKVTVDSVNDAPSIEAISDINKTLEFEPFSVDLNISDVENDALEVNISTQSDSIELELMIPTASGDVQTENSTNINSGSATRFATSTSAQGQSFTWDSDGMLTAIQFDNEVADDQASLIIYDANITCNNLGSRTPIYTENSVSFEKSFTARHELEEPLALVKGEEYTFCVDGPTLKPAYAKGNQYDDGEFKFNNRTYYGYEMV
ncbi:MAG: Ig-like domain-containing protein, partial [Campylobacterota bacterium]|nr:Ig-like domain-containing protein [Campylobacterota bacterium]